VSVSGGKTVWNRMIGGHPSVATVVGERAEAAEGLYVSLVRHSVGLCR
jgi:hypothetical protein